jgi:hypothetical protein
VNSEEYACLFFGVVMLVLVVLLLGLFNRNVFMLDFHELLEVYHVSIKTWLNNASFSTSNPILVRSLVVVFILRIASTSVTFSVATSFL